MVLESNPSIPSPYVFHVGLSPYIDSNGNRRSSYQLLGDRGTAVADIDLVDGKLDRMQRAATVPTEVLDSFIARSQQHDRNARPRVFREPRGSQATDIESISNLERDLVSASRSKFSAPSI